jgi:rhodanese-related sulfurtransferase
VVVAALFHHAVGRYYTARMWVKTRGAVLVDVDTKDEFLCHPFLGAVSIPLASLGSRAHEIGGLDQPIVVCAHSWLRGAQATHALRSVGFWDVYNGAGLRQRNKLSIARAEAAGERQASNW